MKRPERYAIPVRHRLLAGLAMCAGLALSPWAAAQTGASQYHQDRAACQGNGLTGEALRDCLRDVGAARQDRNKSRAAAEPSEAQLRENALRRCDRLPQDRQQECRDMMLGRQSAGTLSTQGSVQGGGVLREFSVPVAR